MHTETHDGEFCVIRTMSQPEASVGYVERVAWPQQDWDGPRKEPLWLKRAWNDCWKLDETRPALGQAWVDQEPNLLWACQEALRRYPTLGQWAYRVLAVEGAMTGHMSTAMSTQLRQWKHALRVPPYIEGYVRTLQSEHPLDPHVEEQARVGLAQWRDTLVGEFPKRGENWDRLVLLCMERKMQLIEDTDPWVRKGYDNAFSLLTQRSFKQKEEAAALDRRTVPLKDFDPMGMRRDAPRSETHPASASAVVDDWDAPIPDAASAWAVEDVYVSLPPLRTDSDLAMREMRLASLLPSRSNSNASASNLPMPPSPYLGPMLASRSNSNASVPRRSESDLARYQQLEAWAELLPGPDEMFAPATTENEGVEEKVTVEAVGRAVSQPLRPHNGNASVPAEDKLSKLIPPLEEAHRQNLDDAIQEMLRPLRAEELETLETMLPSGSALASRIRVARVERPLHARVKEGDIPRIYDRAKALVKLAGRSDEEGSEAYKWAAEKWRKTSPAERTHKHALAVLKLVEQPLRDEFEQRLKGVPRKVAEEMLMQWDRVRQMPVVPYAAWKDAYEALWKRVKANEALDTRGTKRRPTSAHGKEGPDLLLYADILAKHTDAFQPPTESERLTQSAKLVGEYRRRVFALLEHLDPTRVPAAKLMSASELHQLVDTLVARRTRPRLAAKAHLPHCGSCGKPHAIHYCEACLDHLAGVYCDKDCQERDRKAHARYCRPLY